MAPLPLHRGTRHWLAPQKPRAPLSSAPLSSRRAVASGRQIVGSLGERLAGGLRFKAQDELPSETPRAEIVEYLAQAGSGSIDQYSLGRKTRTPCLGSEVLEEAGVALLADEVAHQVVIGRRQVMVASMAHGRLRRGLTQTQRMPNPSQFHGCCICTRENPECSDSQLRETRTPCLGSEVLEQAGVSLLADAVAHPVVIGRRQVMVASMAHGRLRRGLTQGARSARPAYA